MKRKINELENFLTGFKTQRISVAFHDLETSGEFFFHADESLHPASTFKVAVMMEAFHQAAQGTFSLGDRILVINSFRSIADGSPFSMRVEDDAETTLYEKVGHMESLRELLRLMIVRSSNLATNILIQLVTAEKINAYLRELGIDGVTVLRGPEDHKAFAHGMNNSATARGLMLLMKCIAEGKVVSLEASDEMVSILLGQEFNEGIPAGLPPTVRVAHKTGWNDDSYHDFGIILLEGCKPYVLAVMTEGFGLEEQAHAAVVTISKLVFKGS